MNEMTDTIAVAVLLVWSIGGAGLLLWISEAEDTKV
jgi:hypothetical protein